MQLELYNVFVCETICSTISDFQACSHIKYVISLGEPLPAARSSLITRVNPCMIVDFYSMVTRLAPARMADYWRECIQPNKGGEHGFF